MKNLFFILLLLFVIILISCKPRMKQNEGDVKDKADSSEAVSRGIDSTNKDDAAARRSTQDRIYHTCASGYEEHTTGSQGVAASVNVEKLSLQGGVIKSWWIGAYYYTTLPDGRRAKEWVQWGYAVDRGGLFQAFYVYKISPIYGQKWPLTIINQDNTVPLAYNTRVRFEILRVPNSTYWSFLRDGKKVFDVDLGVTSLDGKLQSCTESWGNPSFSNKLHVDYLNYYRDDAWKNLPSGNISSASWLLVGRVQRPEFNPSEHEFGGRLEPITNYLLW